MMDAEQRGWYIQLLAEAWEGSPQNSLPTDLATLKRLAGADVQDDAKSDARFGQVLKQFVSRRCKLTHPRLDRELRKQRAFKAGKSQAGKNGALARWHSHSTAIAQPSSCHDSANGKSMADDSFASAIAIASATAVSTAQPNIYRRPTLDEVKTKAAMIACPEEEAVRFWNHFEASGWIDKNGNPVQKWEPKLSTWTTTARAKAPEQAHKDAEIPKQNDYWKNSKKLEQVENELAAINARASHTATGIIIEHHDKENYKRLKGQRNMLKRTLGLT